MNEKKKKKQRYKRERGKIRKRRERERDDTLNLKMFQVANSELIKKNNKATPQLHFY